MVTLLYQKTCYDTTYRFDDWIQTSKNNTVITMMFSSKKGSHKENQVHKATIKVETYYKNIQKDDYKKPYINMTVSNL